MRVLIFFKICLLACLAGKQKYLPLLRGFHAYNALSKTIDIQRKFSVKFTLKVLDNAHPKC